MDFEHFARDVTIAAPELRAARIFGIPADDDGFIPTDRVRRRPRSAEDVYAAGDVTCYRREARKPCSGASGHGRRVDRGGRGCRRFSPTPFRPVLRARLACGSESVYGCGETSMICATPGSCRRIRFGRRRRRSLRAISLRLSPKIALAAATPFAVGDLTQTIGLTPREMQVAILLAYGHTNSRSLRSCASRFAPPMHRASAMRKLGAASRAHVVRWALDNELLQ